MRCTLPLLFLISTVAGASPLGSFSAQGEPPGASAPPDEPDWARPPPSTGPVESAGERAQRYSRFSAGPGGATVAFTEVMLGLAGGALLGASFDPEGETTNAYTGAMIGGLALGTAGVFYQYFLPVKRGEAILSMSASLLGFMAGIAVSNGNDFSDRERAVAALVSSQAGLFAVLLLTSGGEDVSGADLGLMSMTSLYAFLVTGLIEFIRDAESSRGYNFSPVLLAPAVGLALGGLLSVPLELSAPSLLAMTTLPLLTSGMSIALAAPLAGRATAGRVVLTTLSATFMLTALVTVLTYEPPQATSAPFSAVHLSPMPVLIPAGRDQRSLAAGPGLFMRF